MRLSATNVFTHSQVQNRRKALLHKARLGLKFICLAMCMGAGCMVWHPQWPGPPMGSAPALVAVRLEEAERLGRRVDTQIDLAATIAAYQSLLEIDPSNYRAHATLSHLHLLLGDAYASTTRAKKDYFHRAMVHAEMAMFSNPSFQQSIQRGEPTWEACRVLGGSEMEAILFWVNAVFYTYKEGQSFIGQAINFRWVQRARQVMEHMTSIEPDWGGGALHFTWGVYFLSIPERIGGDRQRSAEYFKQAIEVGPDHLLNRWGRAKYFHVKMKNPQGFREDLEWVLAQDPGRSPGNAAWNAFFVKDARQMLATMDRRF